MIKQQMSYVYGIQQDNTLLFTPSAAAAANRVTN